MQQTDTEIFYFPGLRENLHRFLEAGQAFHFVGFTEIAAIDPEFGVAVEARIAADKTAAARIVDRMDQRWRRGRFGGQEQERTAILWALTFLLNFSTFWRKDLPRWRMLLIRYSGLANREIAHVSFPN